MIIVDAHCDTITKIIKTGENLLNNTAHLDLERVKKFNHFIQFFAAFIDPDLSRGEPKILALDIILKFKEQMDVYKEQVMPCLNYQDIMEALDQKKTGAVLTIEGGDCLEGNLSSLRMFYELGVRSMVLTWNYKNEISDSIGETLPKGGLTSFGIEVIKEMNTLGMMIDVSHISEKGFWDVLETTRAPIIASHSNAKEICGHKRNLTRQQIIAIKKNRGVIGINLYPKFLSDAKIAGLEDVLRHIEYIADLTGEDTLGLGADFDGIESTPAGINGVQDLDRILNELAKRNYSPTFIEKFAGENFLRVLKEVCG